MELGLTLTGVELVADYLLKSYAVSKDGVMLAAGLVAYAGLGWVLANGMAEGMGGLAIANAYWDATSGVATALMATYLFGETLTSNQWFGIVLVCVGLFLIG